MFDTWGSSRRVRRRRAAWSQDGQLFAVPCGIGESISLLDFSPGSHSPCAVNAADGRRPTCYHLARGLLSPL